MNKLLQISIKHFLRISQSFFPQESFSSTYIPCRITNGVYFVKDDLSTIESVRSITYTAKRDSKIHLSFIVNKLGKTKNIKILKGMDFARNFEAYQMIKNMPSWQTSIMNKRNSSPYIEIVIGF